MPEQEYVEITVPADSIKHIIVDEAERLPASWMKVSPELLGAKFDDVLARMARHGIGNPGPIPFAVALEQLAEAEKNINDCESGV